MPRSLRFKAGKLVITGTDTEVTLEELTAKPHHADAMLYRVRLAHYRKQNGCKRLTPAQQRRLTKKKRHRAAQPRRRKRVAR